jgi:diaminopimelate decarboxylase
MTAERDMDTEATVKIPVPTNLDEVEEFDPEKTLVREDWESVVLRRVAPHVAAVQSQVAEDPLGESRFGWESEGLRRLSRGVQRNGE